MILCEVFNVCLCTMPSRNKTLKLIIPSDIGEEENINSIIIKRLLKKDSLILAMQVR